MTGIAADDLPGGPADKDSLVYRAYVFVSPAEADRVTAALDPFVWGGAALGVVLLAGTAAIAARRALRPVDRIRAVAAGISDAPEGARVEVPEAKDELHALTLTLNAMLARIDDAAARQRRFVADAAHELRSPLNSLLVALEVARAHPEALSPERTLAHVEAEARRLADLADELLALSSAAASTPSTPPRCEVIALVQDAVAAAAEHSPVPVELTAPNEAIHVAIAPNALRRAIANLLDNASRHAATRVEVRVHVDPAAALVRIDVANDIAVDEAALSTDDVDRVFEPFVRLDDSRARATGGAGLGLAIVRETVTRAGGTASAASEWPLTTFTLTLPRADPIDTAP